MAKHKKKIVLNPEINRQLNNVVPKDLFMVNHQ